MMSESLSVGQRLRAARKRAGLTQVQVAARAGTVGDAVSQYEIGNKVPKLDTLMRLIAAIGCSPSDVDPRLAATN
jgi:hypothetical protein